MFDLLGIDLVKIANLQFEGTGSIAIPEDGGDVTDATSTVGTFDVGRGGEWNLFALLAPR